MPAKVRFPARLNTNVSQDMKERVERLAEKQDRLPADVVRAAVSAYLRKEESR